MRRLAALRNGNAGADGTESCYRAGIRYSSIQTSGRRPASRQHEYEGTCTMHIFFPIWPDAIEVLSTAYGAVGCKLRRCLRNMFLHEASHQVRLIYQPAFSALLFSASLLLRHLANLASGHRPREANLWTEGPPRLVQEGAGKWGKHRRAHRSEI
jgi:hypothetical protein